MSSFDHHVLQFPASADTVSVVSGLFLLHLLKISVHDFLLEKPPEHSKYGLFSPLFFNQMHELKSRVVLNFKTGRHHLGLKR